MVVGEIFVFIWSCLYFRKKLNKNKKQQKANKKRDKYIINKNVSWFQLSANPNAIYLLEQNLDKITWFQLSANSNAIHLLE